MADVTLRVLRGAHNHKGKTYREGEEFSGPESQLIAFSDKLAKVETPKPKTKTRAKRNGPSNSNRSKGDSNDQSE